MLCYRHYGQKNMTTNFRKSKIFGKLNSWVLDHIQDGYINPNTSMVTDEERIEYIFGCLPHYTPNVEFEHETDALQWLVKKGHCFLYPWTLYDFEIAIKEWGYKNIKKGKNIEWYVPYLIAVSLYRMRQQLKAQREPHRTMKLFYEYSNKNLDWGGDNNYHAINNLFLVNRNDYNDTITLGNYHIETHTDGYFSLQKGRGEGEKRFFKSLEEVKIYAQNVFEQDLKNFLNKDLTFHWVDEETFKRCYSKKFRYDIKPSYNFIEGNYRWRRCDMFYEDNKFKLCNYNTGLILCYDTYLELKEAAETYFMNNFISSVKD